ncbi:MAG: CRTAC1 family protein [Pseudorhodobacter sp.]
MIRALAFILLAAPAWAEGPVAPRFAEETATAGLDSRYAGDWEYMVGGGGAGFDCSGNDMPDLFLAGGEGPASLWRNLSEPGGALRFERVADGPAMDAVTGAYPLDIDGDGITDLAVLRVGENLLLRGLGDCRFERANEAWGFDGGDGWTTAFAATWEAGQDWPTLAFGNYVDRREEAFPWGSCTENPLHRPAESSGFAPPLALTPSHCPLSMLFSDWDRSGRRDLRVSNDREYYKGGQEQLWRMDPAAPPRLYTAEEGWARLRLWGMGIASADVTGDGFPEFYLTSMADNRLQTFAPDGGPERPYYSDIALARGVTAHRPFTGGDVRPSTAWHPQFADVNNDGRLDLFVAKGNVDKMPDFATRDPNNLLVQRADGTFQEMAEQAGVASMEISRGGLVIDLNADGLLDLVVVNRRAPAQIWRNVTEGAGNWLGVSLQQSGGNRDGIGSWIELRAPQGEQRHEITLGGGHVSGQLSPAHFGLGDAAQAEVRVIWPDGVAGDWQILLAGRVHRLTR